MDYQEALHFIHSTHRFGMKLGLDNMKALMNLLDNPQEKLKFIHIAGTNGKGSTSAMISSILQMQGYQVGLFISPYLEEFTERIQINREKIDKKALARITKEVKEKVDEMVSKGYDHPTEFEVVTAIGLKYFGDKKVDLVVLEVGLGGSLDATNIISKSEVSIITSIGLDHMAQLGTSLEEIAGEKAGIIKENGKVVIYPQDKRIYKVIENKAKEKNAKVYFAEESEIIRKENSFKGQVFSYKSKNLDLSTIELSLLGKHQILNAQTILKAIEVLRKKGYGILDSSILEGFKRVTWPGRFEIIHKNPMIILDGAHNMQGARAFSQTIEEFFPKDKIILIIGILKDKEVEKILKEILPVAKEIITITPDNPRAMEGKELVRQVKKINPNIACTSLDSIEEAIKWALNKNAKETIAFTGSLYTIGEVRKKLKDIE